MEEVFRQYPNTTRKEALRQSQSVLKSHRWIVVTDQRVFNHKDRSEAAREKAMEKPRKKPPEAVEAPAPILAPAPVLEPKETPKKRLADILELLLDVVAESVAARVQLKMVDTPPPEPQPKHDPQPIPHPTGYAKPGVLVIGLIPAQAHYVSNLLADKLDLYFFTAEDAVHRPKILRAHTVLMTKFISHAVQDKYRKATDLRFCNGSTGELVSILDKIVPPVL
jgi:hypothetical protein